MASSEERPTRWRAEAEAGPGSGGHVVPETQPPETAFDPLTAPLLSEIEATTLETPRATRPERTDVVPRSTQSARTARERPAGQPARRVRPGIRRVRRTIRTIDPFSVLKLSLFFYSIFLIMWLMFVAVAFFVVDARGVFDQIEDFGQGLVLWEELDISLFFVERWAFLIGLTFLVVASLLNAFLAFLYNLAADLVGGLELTFVEKDT